MKISNINIKEALSLLRLGFTVEDIIELDKELSGGKEKSIRVKKQTTQKKRTTTTTSKRKTQSINDDEFVRR